MQFPHSPASPSLFSAWWFESNHWRARLPGLAWALDSHFQPILSLPHRRTVGFEGLLRAKDATGRAISPPSLFASLPPTQQIDLDLAAAQLHLRNFSQQADGLPPSWLFLNLRPDAFAQTLASVAALKARVLDGQHGAHSHQVVVEITEDILSSHFDLEDCAAQARSIGCLLALDDFGAGHSNFDRVWRLQPEIVKLDRSLVHKGAREPRAGRVVAQMVSLLHECGSLVLMEGIETLDEARFALDCDADLVQGYLFGRPQPLLAPSASAAASVAQVWRDFDQRSGLDVLADERGITPYAQAIEEASLALRDGLPMQQACAGFLALPHAQLCYGLDGAGIQHGASLLAEGFVRQELHRFAPMRDTTLACWAHRPYFRRAMESPGAVQLTRPYLSIQGAQLCVTVSIAQATDAGLLVLCGDLAWLH